MEPLLGEIFHIPKHILDECIILLLAFRQTDENIGAVEFEFKVGQVFDAAVLGGLIDDQGQKTAADHLLNLLLQFCRVLLSTVCRIRGRLCRGFLLYIPRRYFSPRPVPWLHLLQTSPASV